MRAVSTVGEAGPGGLQKRGSGDYGYAPPPSGTNRNTRVPLDSSLPYKVLLTLNTRWVCWVPKCAGG